MYFYFTKKIQNINLVKNKSLSGLNSTILSWRNSIYFLIFFSVFSHEVRLTDVLSLAHTEAIWLIVPERKFQQVQFDDNYHGDPEIDISHLDQNVTYADVIIVCFHDILYQLKYFELQCTLQSNFSCSSHNDPDCWTIKVYHFV